LAQAVRCRRRHYPRRPPPIWWVPAPGADCRLLRRDRPRHRLSELAHLL